MRGLLEAASVLLHLGSILYAFVGLPALALTVCIETIKSLGDQDLMVCSVAGACAFLATYVAGSAPLALMQRVEDRALRR